MKAWVGKYAVVALEAVRKPIGKVSASNQGNEGCVSVRKRQEAKTDGQRTGVPATLPLLIRKLADGHSPSNIGIILEGRGTGLDEIHARLAVQRAAAHRLVGGVMRVGARRRRAVRDLDRVLFLNGTATRLDDCILLCTRTSKFEQLDTGCANGMGPVDRALGVRDTASNFVEQIGRGDGSIKWCYEVCGERVEGLCICEWGAPKRDERHTRVSKRIWSGFQSNSMSSALELFQLSVLLRWAA